MPSEFLPILVIIVLCPGLGFIAIGARPSRWARADRRYARVSPYESGMRPFGPGRRRVPVHFYLMAVLFILFDIEIVFLLPWAVILRDLGRPGLVEMGIFIVVLLVGYVYAWKKGAMEWE